MPGSAKRAVLKLRTKVHAPTLLGEFSRRLGQETLSVHVYRDHQSFLLERRVVERDGTSFTVVLPFKETAEIHAMLAVDPYLENFRAQARYLVIGIEKRLRTSYGKPIF